MTDIEKVIKALQTCSVQNDLGCQCCPYFEERKTYGHEWCTTSMAQDALTLLKEQEPVEPNLHDAVWMCGNCDKEGVGWTDDIYGNDIRYPYCRQCGKAVKWK